MLSAAAAVAATRGCRRQTAAEPTHAKNNMYETLPTTETNGNEARRKRRQSDKVMVVKKALRVYGCGV